tara:strand:- start:1086 stop:1448 length:363 start_codon:yes stop_codon:yes gene_type:complete
LSEIRANTISAANGTSPVTLTKQSAPKAQVNFDGTSMAIRTGSLNISSVTDSATGKYVPNFSTSFSEVPSATGGMTVTNYPGLMRVNPATGSCQIFTSQSYASTYLDSTDTSIQCCGDLS